MEFMSALGSQEDAYRPSLFELVAQEKLRELLQPAVQYILAIYAQRYPRLLIKIVNNHEEFYALLMLLIERHYLKEWGGSFAENFYGLKRVSSTRSDRIRFNAPVNSGSSPSLTQREIIKSLLILVGLPYVKSKLDLLYQKTSGGAASSILGDNEQEELEIEQLASAETSQTTKWMIRLKRLFKKIYPLLNLLFYGSNLCYHVAYLFDKTRYYTPWLHLAGIEVKRMSMQDYRTYYDKTAGPASNTSSFSLRHPLHTLSIVSSKVIEFLKVLLPMSIFFFKFLEWWYSSEFSRNNTSQEGDEKIIPPPEKIKPDPNGIELPVTPNTCPLCKTNPINNPTALPSGYVFCYTCVYHHVQEHGRCPVSLIKVNPDNQLTKLYADVM
ncbi:Peroxisome assembly protein 12 [Choanephora cucurbitarum]|uniref:Peroxisome assembly protein 12 n=1 Tax=Choanephora cucurbitarum TaxID=101091 RepID=A0A1C7NQX4_9FUNG|nr:Peroxisome assembly protein 12 [Choanephora cucurbitarum]